MIKIDDKGKVKIIRYSLGNTLRLRDFYDIEIKDYPAFKKRGNWKADMVCFNYALKNTELETCDEAMDFVFEYFDEIPFEKVKKGDLVMFWFNNKVYHFSVVVKKGKNIKNTIVRGKFGTYAIYEHKLKDTPREYGLQVDFWRKK